jgi:hypothetical protein
VFGTQTGKLTLSAPPRIVTQNGTHGVYTFASQRLWRGERDGDATGVSGFMQLRDFRDATEWAGWEQNKAHKYAIEHVRHSKIPDSVDGGRQAPTATTPKIFTKTTSGTLVLAPAGV